MGGVRRKTNSEHINIMNLAQFERGDGVLRSERNQEIIAQATESSGDDNESCMSNRQLEQRVATVELNPLRQGSTQQASLTESPMIRPPNLAMAGTNQSDGIQLTNQSSFQATNQSSDLQLTNQGSLQAQNQSDDPQLTNQMPLIDIPVTRPHDLVMAPTNRSDDIQLTNQTSLLAANQSSDLPLTNQGSLQAQNQSDGPQLTNQMSLIDIPVTRPPDLVRAPNNQSDDIQLTNQRSLHAANQSPDLQLTNQASLQKGTPGSASCTENSAIRQQSLSLDADLATDQPSIPDRYQTTPDSGFNPGLSGYSSDISGSLSTTIGSLPVSTSNSLSEISEIALNQNGNMIDCDRLRNETLRYAQSLSINRVSPVVQSTNRLADADCGTTCNEGSMNGEGSMNNPGPFSQQYASATSSTCSETHVKSVYPVSVENDHITIIKDDDAQREEVTEVINLNTIGTIATKLKYIGADDIKMETTTEDNLHDSDMTEDVISEDNNVAGSESNVEPLQSKETKDRRKTLLPNLFASVMKCLAKPECAYNGMI